MQIMEKIESGHYQIKRDVRKNKNQYSRIRRKIFETKICRRNLIQGIDTKVVPIVRRSGAFLKWTTVGIQTDGLICRLGL